MVCYRDNPSMIRARDLHRAEQPEDCPECGNGLFPAAGTGDHKRPELAPIDTARPSSAAASAANNIRCMRYAISRFVRGIAAPVRIAATKLVRKSTYMSGPMTEASPMVRAPMRDQRVLSSPAMRRV